MGLRRLILRLKQSDFRPGRADSRTDFGLEDAERGDERTDGMTNESPPVFYRTSSPSGPLPNKGFEPRGWNLTLETRI